jgi:hypothetical protein
LLFVRSFAASVAELLRTTMYWPGMTFGCPVAVSGAGAWARAAAGASTNAVAASTSAMAECFAAGLP